MIKLNSELLKISKIELSGKECKNCYVFNKSQEVIERLIVKEMQKLPNPDKLKSCRIIGNYKRRKDIDDENNQCYEVSIYEVSNNEIEER